MSAARRVTRSQTKEPIEGNVVVAREEIENIATRKRKPASDNAITTTKTNERHTKRKSNKEEAKNNGLSPYFNPIAHRTPKPSSAVVVSKQVSPTDGRQKLQKGRDDKVTNVNVGTKLAAKSERKRKSAELFNAADVQKKRQSGITTGLNSLDMAECGPQSSSFSTKKMAGTVVAQDVESKDASGPLLSSDSEWEDVDELPHTSSFTENQGTTKKDVEITIKAPITKMQMDLDTAVRREVNRQMKEHKESVHKAHLLCYIAHGLRYSAACNDALVRACALSIIPPGYIDSIPLKFDVTVLQKLVKWFLSAIYCRSHLEIGTFGQLHVLKADLMMNFAKKECASAIALVSMFVAMMRSLKLEARLLISAQPESFRVDSPLITKRKTTDTTNTKGTLSSTKKSEKNEPKSKVEKRNYWAEVYLTDEKRWIPVCLVSGELDSPSTIEGHCTAPICYILSFDNDGGVKDVTSRYASKYLTVSHRRRRIDDEWWTATLRLRSFAPKQKRRDRREDMELHDFLSQQPLPTSVGDFKDHPLYVLKRHLLKFQAIYPEDTPSLGKIRDEEIYPRKNVYTLHAKESWIKEARVIKENETPYKIVKARPKLAVSKEEPKEDRPLPLYGFWQTKVYKPKRAKDGIVPRNEYGNVELYIPEKMLPPGTVHLQLPGLLQVARKLNIDCAPAVVGWEFHCRSSHPIIDGCVVCAEFSERLVDAWNREQDAKEARQKQKRAKRAKDNWRRLVKRIVVMERLKKRFGHEEHSKKPCSSRTNKECTLSGDEETTVPGDGGNDLFTENPNAAWPRCQQQFEL